ncbi:unnamed protein product [Amoebophrya sp. A120]|nr:unnamed protein product [Amoebophrya sp. A120]|eukprot:GSA120T00003187001.1
MCVPLLKLIKRGRFQSRHIKNAPLVSSRLFVLHKSFRDMLALFSIIVVLVTSLLPAPAVALALGFGKAGLAGTRSAEAEAHQQHQESVTNFYRNFPSHGSTNDAQFIPSTTAGGRGPEAAAAVAPYDCPANGIYFAIEHDGQDANNSPKARGSASSASPGTNINSVGAYLPPLRLAKSAFVYSPSAGLQHGESWSEDAEQARVAAKLTQKREELTEVGERIWELVRAFSSSPAATPNPHDGVVVPAVSPPAQKDPVRFLRDKLRNWNAVSAQERHRLATSLAGVLDVEGGETVFEYTTKLLETKLLLVREIAQMQTEATELSRVARKGSKNRSSVRPRPRIRDLGTPVDLEAGLGDGGGEGIMGPTDNAVEDTNLGGTRRADISTLFEVIDPSSTSRSREARATPATTSDMNEPRRAVFSMQECLAEGMNAAPLGTTANDLRAHNATTREISALVTLPHQLRSCDSGRKLRLVASPVLCDNGIIYAGGVPLYALQTGQLWNRSGAFAFDPAQPWPGGQGGRGGGAFEQFSVYLEENYKGHRKRVLYIVPFGTAATVRDTTSPLAAASPVITNCPRGEYLAPAAHKSKTVRFVSSHDYALGEKIFAAGDYRELTELNLQRSLRDMHWEPHVDLMQMERTQRPLQAVDVETGHLQQHKHSATAESTVTHSLFCLSPGLIGSSLDPNYVLQLFDKSHAKKFFFEQDDRVTATRAGEELQLESSSSARQMNFREKFEGGATAASTAKAGKDRPSASLIQAGMQLIGGLIGTPRDGVEHGGTTANHTGRAASHEAKVLHSTTFAAFAEPWTTSTEFFGDHQSGTGQTPTVLGLSSSINSFEDDISKLVEEGTPAPASAQQHLEVPPGGEGGRSLVFSSIPSSGAAAAATSSGLQSEVPSLQLAPNLQTYSPSKLAEVPFHRLKFVSTAIDRTGRGHFFHYLSCGQDVLAPELAAASARSLEWDGRAEDHDGAVRLQILQYCGPSTAGEHIEEDEDLDENKSVSAGIEKKKDFGTSSSLMDHLEKGLLPRSESTENLGMQQPRQDYTSISATERANPAGLGHEPLLPLERRNKKGTAQHSRTSETNQQNDDPLVFHSSRSSPASPRVSRGLALEAREVPRALSVGDLPALRDREAELEALELELEANATKREALAVLAKLKSVVAEHRSRAPTEHSDESDTDGAAVSRTNSAGQRPLRKAKNLSRDNFTPFSWDRTTSPGSNSATSSGLTGPPPRATQGGVGVAHQPPTLGSSTGQSSVRGSSSAGSTPSSNAGGANAAQMSTTGGMTVIVSRFMQTAATVHGLCLILLAVLFLSVAMALLCAFVLQDRRAGHNTRNIAIVKKEQNYGRSKRHSSSSSSSSSSSGSEEERARTRASIQRKLLKAAAANRRNANTRSGATTAGGGGPSTLNNSKKHGSHEGLQHHAGSSTGKQRMNNNTSTSHGPRSNRPLSSGNKKHERFLSSSSRKNKNALLMSSPVFAPRPGASWSAGAQHNFRKQSLTSGRDSRASPCTDGGVSVTIEEERTEKLLQPSLSQSRHVDVQLPAVEQQMRSLGRPGHRVSRKVVRVFGEKRNSIDGANGSSLPGGATTSSMRSSPTQILEE